MLAMTSKEYTAFERSAVSPGSWGGTVRECTHQVDLRAVQEGVDSYVSLSSVFDDWNGTVFLDDFGHVTEVGNRGIAEAIVERVLGALSEGPYE